LLFLFWPSLEDLTFYSNFIKWALRMGLALGFA
jgi:hypothetical protein